MVDAGHGAVQGLPATHARAPAGAALAVVCLLLVYAIPARGAIVQFGSSLRARASLSTDNLDYKGINTPYGSGVVHTAHEGADTALWNVAVAGGRAAAPAPGQVTAVSLEGCAERAAGGPRPLTQIHFQALSPQAGGAAKVQLTSQSFEMPVCGEHGAGAATVSTYRPTGLCVDRGYYVAFDDEGGYVENYYRAGVPYRVIASSGASRMDSFVMAGGTGNGSVLSPALVAPADGFAANQHQELLLRATLATGTDAMPDCRHGLRG
jgi:hypothetical protein